MALKISEQIKDVLESVDFCCEFCCVGSKPTTLIVTLICEDGLVHEYERGIDCESLAERLYS